MKTGLADMRRAVAALRPVALENFSLPVALDGLVVQFTHTTGIPTDWQVEGNTREMAPRLALPLYRAVQEALTKIRRHAATTPKVHVRLRYEPETVSGHYPIGVGKDVDGTACHGAGSPQ